MNANETIAEMILHDGIRMCNMLSVDRDLKDMQSEDRGNYKNKFKNGARGVKARIIEILSKHPDITREQLRSAILTVTANPTASGRKPVSYVVLRYTGASWLCDHMGYLRDMRDELTLRDDPEWFPWR